MTAATEGAARSVFVEDRIGNLAVGKLAGFVVVDMKWKAEELLKASVEETWFAGTKIYG